MRIPANLRTSTVETSRYNGSTSASQAEVLSYRTSARALGFRTTGVAPTIWPTTPSPGPVFLARAASGWWSQVSGRRQRAAAAREPRAHRRERAPAQRADANRLGARQPDGQPAWARTSRRRRARAARGEAAPAAQADHRSRGAGQAQRSARQGSGGEGGEAGGGARGGVTIIASGMGACRLRSRRFKLCTLHRRTGRIHHRTCRTEN